jgi:hypothetical protein
MRGALRAYGNLQADTISRNLIFPDGRIEGLDLAPGERLTIRDDDGLSESEVHRWQQPRPPIAVSIEDRLRIEEGGVLQLVFDADPWDSLISFEAGIPVQLSGALELGFANGVRLMDQVGRTLRIVDWTGVSPNGQFEIRSPYVWDVSSLYTTGEVKLIAVPEPCTEWILLVSVLSFVAFCRIASFRLGN